ncbi:hypothetical protein D9M69_484530 [compost metagenome]
MPGDSIGIRGSGVVFVGRDSSDTDDIGDSASGSLENSARWERHGNLLPLSERRVRLDWGTRLCCRQIGDGLPAASWRSNGAYLAYTGGNVALDSTGRGHGYFASRRNSYRIRERPVVPILVARDALSDDRAGLPAHQQVNLRIRGNTAADAVDLHVARQAIALGSVGREGVVRSDGRSVGVTDGQSQNAEELAVLAVVAEIHVRTIDRAELLLQIVQHLSIARRRDAAGIDDRCGRRGHSERLADGGLAIGRGDCAGDGQLAGVGVEVALVAVDLVDAWRAQDAVANRHVISAARALS